jgi:hypothetical protein
MAAEPKTKTLGRGSDSTTVRLDGFTVSDLVGLGMTGATNYIRVESMVCQLFVTF